MKRVIDTSEVLGAVDTPDGEYEVCASANASYDPTTGQLMVKLEAFLRATNIRIAEKRLCADWLPKPETVTESVGAEETVELARDIFKRLVRKVRQASPSLQHLTI